MARGKQFRLDAMACSGSRQAFDGFDLILLKVFILSGLDQVIETSLTRAMPDWLVNLTTQL